MSENQTNTADYLVSAGLGYGTYKGTRQVLQKNINQKLIKQITNVPQRLNDTFWNSATDAYRQSRLSANIVHLDKNNLNDVTRNVIDGCGFSRNKIYNNWLYKLIFGDVKQKMRGSLNAISNGRNACYIPKLNKVIVNRDKMAFSVFHELGHSMNANGAGIAKWLNKSRGYFALGAPLILALSLLTNKSKENEDGKIGVFGKIKNFIKNNCGILAAACMLPTVAEEGLASIKGAKLAKPHLDKTAFKTLNGLNAKAWCTYLAAAAITGIAVKAAVVVRDTLMEKSKNSVKHSA